MISVKEIGTKIMDEITKSNTNAEIRIERRKIEEKIETLLYNELQIVVNQGGINPNQIEKIALLKDLVKMFKEPTEINVRCEKSS